MKECPVFSKVNNSVIMKLQFLRISTKKIFWMSSYGAFIRTLHNQLSGMGGKPNAYLWWQAYVCLHGGRKGV